MAPGPAREQDHDDEHESGAGPDEIDELTSIHLREWYSNRAGLGRAAPLR